MALLAIALTAIGILEWAKVPFPKAPSYLWWILLPVFCLGAAAVRQYLPQWVGLGVAGVSVASLAYDNIVKMAKAKIDSLRAQSIGNDPSIGNP